LDVHFRIAEVPRFLVLNQNTAKVQALPSCGVVVAEEPLAVRQETVEPLALVGLAQFLMQPRPVLLAEQPVPAGDLVEQMTEELLRVRGADGVESAQRQVKRLFESAIVCKAIVDSQELACKGMGIGMHALPHSQMPDMGHADRRADAGIGF